MRRLELKGKRFGYLFVNSFAYVKNGMTYWNCICDCGNTKIVPSGSFTPSRQIKSCGCENRRALLKANTKHNLSKHPLFGVWADMLKRCNNPNCVRYKWYGGRGISVCKEWLNDFKAFYDWAMDNGYLKGLEIDRINNDGGYSPENCRLVTHQENCKNKRKVNNCGAKIMREKSDE